MYTVWIFSSVFSSEEIRKSAKNDEVTAMSSEASTTQILRIRTQSGPAGIAI